ncbi:hypothetical protein P691DRAFT_666033 [Macrolepiota fuliginosa MF-IS2]|uniref:Uncharacterized protein n=1 Tax=Macrolepiota fuliginosa MF-IS2 TaxID=1400762 RepID=A0A9P6C5T6_9AGAR|nr:hypothetical protein P691DRAFT_666033 [Macrolepiota fuliginosa MF-IS2]
MNDDRKLDSPRKMVQRKTVLMDTDKLSFSFPYHKADRFYEGNKILMFQNATTANPLSALRRYLIIRDLRFPNHRDLWV